MLFWIMPISAWEVTLELKYPYWSSTCLDKQHSNRLHVLYILNREEYTDDLDEVSNDRSLTNLETGLRIETRGGLVEEHDGWVITQFE